MGQNNISTSIVNCNDIVVKSIFEIFSLIFFTSWHGKEIPTYISILKTQNNPQKPGWWCPWSRWLRRCNLVCVILCIWWSYLLVVLCSFVIVCYVFFFILFLYCWKLNFWFFFIHSCIVANYICDFSSFILVLSQIVFVIFLHFVLVLLRKKGVGQQLPSVTSSAASSDSLLNNFLFFSFFIFLCVHYFFLIFPSSRRQGLRVYAMMILSPLRDVIPSSDFGQSEDRYPAPRTLRSDI